MLIRDGPGFGLYWMVFESNKRRFGVSDKDRVNHDYYGMSKGQIGFRKSIAGGISGCLIWALVYPVDTLKTKLQTASNSNKVGMVSIA